MAFYVDYPGYLDSPSPVAITERLVEYAVALREAKRVYRTTDVPKVVVCSHPSLRRVATICGDRTRPRVIENDAPQVSPAEYPF